MNYLFGIILNIHGHCTTPELHDIFATLPPLQLNFPLHHRLLLPEAEGGAGGGGVAGDLAGVKAAPRHGPLHGVRSQPSSWPEE